MGPLGSFFRKPFVKTSRIKKQHMKLTIVSSKANEQIVRIGPYDGNVCKMNSSLGQSSPTTHTESIIGGDDNDREKMLMIVKEKRFVS